MHFSTNQAMKLTYKLYVSCEPIIILIYSFIAKEEITAFILLRIIIIMLDPSTNDFGF